MMMRARSGAARLDGARAASVEAVSTSTRVTAVPSRASTTSALPLLPEPRLQARSGAGRLRSWSFNSAGCGRRLGERSASIDALHVTTVWFAFWPVTTTRYCGAGIGLSGEKIFEKKPWSDFTFAS